MIWAELEVGDVLVSSYSGDVGTYLLIETRTCPTDRKQDGGTIEITIASLLDARVVTYSRLALAKLSPIYTVLRGANVVQQGDGR